jgi:mannobiose 2-epimerase
MFRPLALTVALLACTLPIAAQDAKRPKALLLTEGRDVLAGDLTYALQQNLLDAWYPRAVDSLGGGFLSRFDYRWQPVGDQQKMVVTQARHVWTTAQAAQFFPDDASAYRAAATHGLAFLRDRMWDPEHGGFYWLVTRDGTPIPEHDGRLVKQAYGNAFGIYALAAYHDATGDEDALRFAQEAFRWLDAHAHDPQHGGYFNYLDRDGTPFRAGYADTPPKDQNSSIHLLEAFTELYHVWPDPTLRDRLHELLVLIRDTITVEPGTLTLFATADWQPISYRDSTAAAREANGYLDHVSFGHDVETAYLMLEAAEALGLDTGETLRAGKKMVDHALRTGWDDAVGGFVEAGYYFAGDTTLTIVDATKNWWAQAEGLNTLLLLGDRFPDDPMRYHDRFLDLWAYLQAYLVDHRYGGWYAGGLDQQPRMRTADKGHIWKAAYHDGRALMNLIRRLRTASAE